jgi:hypothetical protein
LVIRFSGAIVGSERLPQSPSASIEATELQTGDCRPSQPDKRALDCLKLQF